MNVNIIDNLDRKGLGTTDLLRVIPVGRKGTSYTRVATDGATIMYEFNSHIRDAEIKVAVALLSHTFHALGTEAIGNARRGVELPTISDDLQPIYMRAITIDAKELSEQIYSGDRGRGKRAFTALKHLENLRMVYSYNNGREEVVIRLFQNVAYGKGNIVFDVANFLINRLEHTFTAFRLAPVLAHNGLSMRLSLYVETNQRKYGTYKDSDGKPRNSYVPMNEYYLDELINGLRLHGEKEADAVKIIQEAFNELATSAVCAIPKFTYNKKRRSFESEYKNGTKHKLIN